MFGPLLCRYAISTQDSSRYVIPVPLVFSVEFSIQIEKNKLCLLLGGGEEGAVWYHQLLGACFSSAYSVLSFPQPRDNKGYL